jgi:hypothetical protein
LLAPGLQRSEIAPRTEEWLHAPKPYLQDRGLSLYYARFSKPRNTIDSARRCFRWNQASG